MGFLATLVAATAVETIEKRQGPAAACMALGVGDSL